MIRSNHWPALTLALCALLGGVAGAADATSDPTSAPTTSPATASTSQASAGIVSPEAAAVLRQVTDAYAKVQGLKLAGKISGEFDVDGQQDSRNTAFRSTFKAPFTFRTQTDDGTHIGSTGEKLYVYEQQRNLYLMDDAPKAKVALTELPGPFADLVGAQDISLSLALASDAGAELIRGFEKISRANDETIDGTAYPALDLTGRQDIASSRVLIDPKTHLLRRVLADVSPALRARGAKEVKKARITVDYPTSSAEDGMAGEQFAWAPPPGATDAAAAAGGNEGPAAELAGKPAPDFSMKDLEDKDVKLADLKGSVVVLDFWATWCGPCVASLPGLDRVNQQVKAAGVKIFAVNQAEDKELVSGFMKSKNLTLPVLLDAESKVGASYKVQAIPTTVVIGKDGVIRKIFVGAGPDHEAKVKQAIDEAGKATK